MIGKWYFGLRKAMNILLCIVFLLGLATAPAAQAQESAAGGLGQPGLSFRYARTFGVLLEPYPADGTHLNYPWGIVIDASNNLYVAEESGSRVLKYNSSGANTLIVGEAGVEFHHDDLLPNPKDVAVASNGNFWVVTTTMLKEFDADGTVLRRFPDEDPWNEGNDNNHFRDARGIGISNSGLLFVADTGNNRVQIYDISTDVPTYVNSIGEPGVESNDNTHLVGPTQVDFDSQDALFVFDSGNYRVQKCTSSDSWASWSCSTFFGGSRGSNLANGEMSWGQGFHVDPSNNVFIADGENSRIIKCTAAGSCAHFTGTLGVRGSGNNVFGWAADVATHSSGRVYVSDTDNKVVKQYSSSGTFIKNFVWTLAVPYVVDTARLNEPWGVVTDSAGNVYITENRGHRLVKLNASGVQQWTIGSAGNFIFDWNNVPADNRKFSNYWAGLEGNPAIDAAGNIYVADTSNHRVQVYKTSDGSYVATMGVFREGGTENNRFDCPTGVAISPVNSDIFVTDSCNQRVQVFNSSRVYKTTIGVPDETGDDNLHLKGPWNVAVDKNGAVYVADADNHRIQKCTLAGMVPTCLTIIGETGAQDNLFSHFYPVSVAVDAAGRIYVADEWNTRVLVYDNTGAYLTTIAGAWGQRNSQLVSSVGVTVDSLGNVYVADRNNHRVEKYTPNVPGWVQTNINGFGVLENRGIVRLGEHEGMLYASTDTGNRGGEIWRSADGKNWTNVTGTPGLNNPENTTLLVGASFNGYLYAGTANNVNGGEMWRCDTCNGSDWQRVLAGSVLGASYNTVQRVTVHGSALYAIFDSADGIAVLRSTSGASGTWSQVNQDGFGDLNNVNSWTAIDFNGYYYVGTVQGGSWGTGENSATGAEIWRCSTCTGSDWQQVNADGFGHNKNVTWSAEILDNALYISTGNLDTGGQVWRCSTCNGSDWERVNEDGFGSGNLTGDLTVFDGKLYALMTELWGGQDKGVQVFVYQGGTQWDNLSVDGWGDHNNGAGFDGIVFKDNLYFATKNEANGGELWLYLSRKTFLPGVMK